LVVENQRSSSSCAGHSEALAFAHANFLSTGEVLRFSRRFSYLTSQSEGGYLGADQGTSINSTLEAATKYGCCLEEQCVFQEAYSTQIPKTAYEAAAKHKHFGPVNYDCRDWDVMLDWIADKRPVIIGTPWYSGQGQVRLVETKNSSSGSFLGWHARCLTGWDHYEKDLCPVVQNSHGENWGNHGRAIVTRDQWEFWRRNANFVALGFSRIDEVEPKRRSWKESKPGDTC